MNENYEHIYNLDRPHFTVGRADQWGETCSPMAIGYFLAYAAEQQISVPDDFMAKLKEILR